VWTPDQLATFLAASRRWRPLWLLLASCGLRIGEARALQWGDVDLAIGILRVSRSIYQVDGEDVVSTPKTQAGIRTITLPAQAVAALKEWRCRQAAELMRLGVRDDLGWIWTNDEANLIKYDGIKEAWRRDCARAGLKGTIHGLRHWHATMLLAGGLPVADVARRLGHANPSITMSTYAHAMGHDDRAADIVSRALGPHLGRELAQDSITKTV
jgi:integrase